MTLGKNFKKIKLIIASILLILPILVITKDKDSLPRFVDVVNADIIGGPVTPDPGVGGGDGCDGGDGGGGDGCG